MVFNLDDIFHNDLQKQAHERQVNRHNMVI
jgi:hypothetical protein